VTYGLAGGGNSYERETRNQVSDTMSWTKGAHQIKFGVDFNILQDIARSSNNSGGNYSYSKATLGANINCPQSKANQIFCEWVQDMFPGDQSNDGRQGIHWSTYNQFHDTIFPGPPDTFRYVIPNHDYAGFLQDTWKARPNLTVNAGVRYDLQVISDLPNSIKNVLAGGTLPPGSFDPPILDQYTSVYPNEYDGIQPRLGLAWNVKKNTVIRADGGILVAKTEGHNIKNVISGAGEATTACTPSAAGSESTCLFQGSPQFATLTFPNVYWYQQDGPLSGILPAGALQTQVVCGPGFGLQFCAQPIPSPAFGIRGVDPNLRRPHVYTVNVAFEQQLAGGMNLSVSYDYSRGIDLPRGRDFNMGPAFDPTFCTTAAPTFGSPAGQTCPGLNIAEPYDIVDTNGVTQQTYITPLYSSLTPIAGNGTTIVGIPGLASNPAVAYSSRLDPRTGVLNGNSSTADSRYNGLIVALRKPMSHGLELVANYTYSVAKDNGEQGGGNSGTGQVGIPAIDPFNNAAENGYSGTDTRNRFTASVVYQPTLFENSSNKFAKQALGGWQLASAIIAQNGTHYTGMINSNSTQALNVTGFTRGSTASTTYTFSPLDGSMGGAGITSPGSPFAGQVGWLPRGGFVLPNLYNVDLRFTKQLAF
jgi:hypothetical protein